MTGCNDTTDTKSSKGEKAAGSISSADDSKAQRCQGLFDSAMTRVRPQNLGISSKSTSAALALNDWFRRCGTDDWEDNWSEAADAFLDETTARRAAANRFSESDALYIRTCLLMRKYAKSVPGRSDTERVMGLFYAVVRDIALRDNGVALTPFEITMIGRGSAADRAWVFVEALRQLRIDGFIIEPAEKKEAWLVGASVEDEVLLFDMRLGLPIFKAADYTDGPLPQTAVKLSELSGDDEILGSMSSDYPGADADFENTNVFVVGGSSTFAQRSLVLQNALTGDDTTVLCDPIQDIADGIGLAGRVAKAGGWDQDTVSLWTYSAEKLDGFSRLNEADQVRLAELILPLKARVERRADGKQLVFGTPHWELFQARIDQLSLGTPENVTTQYQKIRLGKMKKQQQQRDDRGVKFTVTAPDEFVAMHNRAAEDAGLWVAVQQYRDEQFEAAINGFYTYRRLHPEESAWAGQAEYLLALALAESGDFGKAIEYIDIAASQEGPHADGFRVLATNWKNQLPAGSEVKEDEPAEPEPKAAETPKEEPVAAEEDEKAKGDEAKADEKKEEEKKEDQA